MGTYETFSNDPRLNAYILAEACLDIFDGSLVFLISYDVIPFKSSKSASAQARQRIYPLGDHGGSRYSRTVGRGAGEERGR